MRFIVFIILFYLPSLSFNQELNYIFKSGDDGYNCFRIPTIIKAKNDVILAFAEGRKKVVVILVMLT